MSKVPAGRDAALSPYASVPTLAQAYRSGVVSPVEVAEISLARLEALEPQLNAVIEPMRDLALAMARTAHEELRQGLDRGPLHGVPVAIKDLIDIAGQPTSYATRAVDPVMAKQDADLITRLREAGAVFLGKTNLLEFAYGIAHPDVGQTNNPFDTRRTSGGSSGGSTALVAAGVVPLSVGTDTGGSIRIPAAYCGIVGHKPTYGTVSSKGVFPLSWSLDHAGPLARSVADAATLLGSMAGRSFEFPVLAVDHLRIGLMQPHLGSPLVTAGVRDCVEIAIRRLAERGARLVPVSFAEPQQVSKILMTVLLPEASLVHEQIYALRPGGYAQGTRSQIEAGFKVKGVDYVRAQRQRAELTTVIEALFESVDVLLSPSVSFVAPAEDPALEGEGGDAEGLSSGLANVTGHPAISIPCGLSDGLPVGLQLMGRFGRDPELFAAAAAIEHVLGFSARPAI